MRVAWLLEELGLEYEIQKFALGDRAMREPDYLAVHPWDAYLLWKTKALRFSKVVRLFSIF